MAITSNIHVNLSTSSKEMRAQRLKRLRKTSGLSRKDFSKKYNISPGTLQNWETARFGGLTEKGANLIISALKCEKIFCTFEWLMYQSGSGPKFDHIEPQIQVKGKEKKASSANEDLKVFQKLNPNTLHLQIDDDSMAPHFTRKHLIAGTRKSYKQLNAFWGHVCLVKTACLDKLVLRLIKPYKSNKDLFYLIHLNPLEDSITNLNQLYTIDYFAPVEWIRKI